MKTVECDACGTRSECMPRVFCGISADSLMEVDICNDCAAAIGLYNPRNFVWNEVRLRDILRAAMVTERAMARVSGGKSRPIEGR